MVNNENIKQVADIIAASCKAIKIILVSHKVNTSGVLTSFKLALIVNDDVKSISELECELYMKVDSELPFDLVLYKLSEWNELKNEIGTFAWKIDNSGAVIYG